MGIVAIARRVMPLLAWAGRSALRVAWDAPWFAFIALLWTLGICLAAARSAVVLVKASRDTARCPRCGHHEPLLGTWRCPVCKAVQATHAWAACTICSTAIPAGYISCSAPGCGEAIRNPKLRRLW